MQRNLDDGARDIHFGGTVFLDKEKMLSHDAGDRTQKRAARRCQRPITHIFP